MRPFLPLLLVAACTGGSPPPSHQAPPLSDAALASSQTADYVLGEATLDGSGKYYLGREISLVMGHQAAEWLDRDTREGEERTDLLLDFLTSQEGRSFADIGAGTGYFAVEWARRAPAARVLAVDIQREMLDILGRRASDQHIRNVQPVLGSIEDPGLPEGEVDVALIVDAYHEFSHPREMVAGIVRGLRPGGRLVLVEYRGEDPFIPIKELHKMTEEQAILELTSGGLEWVETLAFLPWQHVLVFEKPRGPGA